MKSLSENIQVNDIVASTPNSDFSCLIGVVEEIIPLGTEAQKEFTEEDTDIFVINFLAFDYPEKVKKK